MMFSIIEVIKQRHSDRAYSGRKVEEGLKKDILDYALGMGKGPFGNTVRFQLVESLSADGGAAAELKQLGTYGMIKGASLYLAGAVKKSEKSMEDFGYCMEAAILKAAGSGISSCWLGGTFNRSSFAKKIGLGEDEVIPAVTPLGYPGDKSTLLVGILGMSRGNRSRKPFEELFFEGGIGAPLKTPDLDENYRTVLECVRLAPSASNKQPWRIIRDKDMKKWHFYLDEDKLYNNVFKDIKLQNVDIGIAMCHFDLSAKESGLAGSWKTMKPVLNAGKLLYIVSWSVNG